MFLLLCQEPPFWHENHKELFEEIKTKQPYWEDHTHLSPAASSLLHQLLEKDPKKRIGTNGIEELKNHAYFADIDWDDVLQKKLKPPYIPGEGKNTVNIPVSKTFYFLL